MSIKKEQAYAHSPQYNHITKVAKRLRNAKTSVLDMLSHPVISDVNIKGGEFEFMIDDFEAFYEESEGCHIYIEHHDSDSKEFPYKAFFRLYNNRFAILLTHVEVNKLRNLLNKEDYTDRVSKDVYAMTIGGVVKSGYTLQVSNYSEKNKEQAKNKIEKEDYTDRESKDVYDMTSGELVKSGNTLTVNHYSEKNKEQAKELLEEFEQIHDVEDNHSDGFGWFSMGDGNVDISVFYD